MKTVLLQFISIASSTGTRYITTSGVTLLTIHIVHIM